MLRLGAIFVVLCMVLIAVSIGVVLFAAFGLNGAEATIVAIGALLSHAAVSSVIAGATQPEQVRANVQAGRWHPTSDDLAEIDRIAPPPQA